MPRHLIADCPGAVPSMKMGKTFPADSIDAIIGDQCRGATT
ncbi:MAG TPA: hypothetical protein P5536_02815 [Methanoregulaceae archaeon]|nr:hypothetical protein [Methanoregulaceae archaeon]